MTIEQQAQHLLAIWSKTRFTLGTMERLYMIQESFEVAEERISFLSNGLVTEAKILEVISEAEGQLKDGDRLAYDIRFRNLRTAIAHFEGMERETRFSALIRQRQNALDSLKEAMVYIEDIPKKAIAELYTPEVDQYVTEKANRLKEYQAKLEKDLAELTAWHEVELRAGQFELVRTESADV